MLLLSLLFSAIITAVHGSNWTNNSVKRLVYLTSSVVREELSLTVTLNETPKEGEEPRYLLNIPSHKSDGLAFWKAFYVDSKDERQILEMTEITIESDEKTYLGQCKPLMSRCFWVEGFRMAGLNKLQAESSIELVINLSYGGLLVPVPKVNVISATLSVEYEDSAYFWSPYKTEKQKTTIALPKDFKVLVKGCPTPNALTPKTSSTLPAGMIQYSCGVYQNINAHVSSKERLQFTVQYIQIPFLKVKSLERSLNILPWFNQLQVTENWDLSHEGFQLNKHGHFSRVEYMKLVQNRSPTSQVLGNIVFVVDEDAYDFDVRDENGRLTGMIRKMPPTGPKANHFRGQNFLHVTPRYPLIGGWSASYHLTYKVPLNKHLKAPEPGKRSISLPFFSTFFDILIEDFSLKVNLPEDAQKIEYIYDEFGIAQFQDRIKRYKTYLSTTGEVSLQLSAKNVIKEHSQPLTINYNYPWWGLLRKPSTFVIYIIVLILSLGAIQFLSQVSFEPKANLFDTKKAKKELVKLFKARRNCLNNLDDTLTTADIKARQQLESELTEITAKIFEILRKVLAEDMAISLYGANLKKLYEEHFSCIKMILGLHAQGNLKSRSPSVENLEKDAQELDKRILALESQLFA